MKTKDIDYSLYLVAGSDICGRERFFDYIERSIQGGVTLVQLREKSASGRELYETAVNVRKLTNKYNIPLIINDRVDIALAVDADGVHLGQNDLPCHIARKILGNDRIIGLSARNIEKAIEAEQSGANYLGVGAMFPTSTKTDAKVVTPSVIKEIKNRIKIPVVAIGGIGADNIDKLQGCDIDGIAVVSAIMASKFPEKSAENLIDKFRKL